MLRLGVIMFMVRCTAKLSTTIVVVVVFKLIGWLVDKEAIGVSRVQNVSTICNLSS